MPAVIHYFFYSTGESVGGPDSSGAAHACYSTCLSLGTGGDHCFVRSQVWQGRLVPAVIHDFFILQVRVCGDLTAVEQHNACYLPEPRDRQGPLLGLGWRERLVPAVIPDFFYSRVCGDLTAVDQHNACYLH